MRWAMTSLSADDVNRGASEWLSSRPRRLATAGFGTVVGLAWALAVVCSVVSWADVVPVAPVVMVDIAAFTALSAVLWLVGNLFRLVNLRPRIAGYNPFSRINLTLYALLLGLTRPTRRTVSFSILTLLTTVTVIAANARFGWSDHVSTRVAGGHPQVGHDDGVWAVASDSTFRSARAAEFRSDALAALLADTVLMLSMVSLYRLRVEGDRDATPIDVAQDLSSDRLVTGQLRGKRRA